MSRMDVSLIRIDGGTQTRESINESVVSEYAEAMTDGAKFPPIVVFHDGADYWLADGFHRLAAAKRIGTVEMPADIRQGTRRDAILFSVGANSGHGLRRTNSDKRRAVETLLNDTEGYIGEDGERHYWHEWSDREIARRCAVSHEFVRSLRSSLSTNDSEPRTYTTKHGTTATMNTENIGRGTNHVNGGNTVAVYDGITSPTKPHVAHNSGENEWYTPPQYIEAARRAMGSIDCDPASSEAANEMVKADQFFTIEDDGLSLSWVGNVWLNPPYSQPEIAQFCDAVAEKYREDEISQAVILVNNATETAWFQALLSVASAVCFPRGRIKYLDRTGTPANTPLQGQALIYLGARRNEFLREFSEFGVVLWMT